MAGFLHILESTPNMARQFLEGQRERLAIPV
jgi:hypothetical protein